MNQKETIKLPPPLWFTYCQFLVYDSSVEKLNGPWAEFTALCARANSVVSFVTILEQGYADVTVTFGPFVSSNKYDRVVSVPFEATCGKTVVGGPEEDWNLGRTLTLEPGHYCLTAAQIVDDEDEELETIHLFIEKVATPLLDSIVIADRYSDASGGE